MRSVSPVLVTILLPLAACATPAKRSTPTGLPLSDASFLEVRPTAPSLGTSNLGTSSLGTSSLGGSPLASHATTEDALSSPDAQGSPGRRSGVSSHPSRWRVGTPLMHGYFGASINQLERSGGGVSVEADDVELPAIGGGAQWKLAGDKVDLGLEGMLGFNWRAGSTAFVVGGGGAAVAVDVDMFVMDLYGGPFASMFLGDSLRVYAGAGPLMQWAFYDERGVTSEDGSGFGLGYYARTGIDFQVGSNALLGFGVRWSDSSIDVGGNLGDVDVEGLLWMVTWSYFY